MLALVDAGALRRTGGGWELADRGDEPAVPDTLHDLLRARLDRLGTARLVAQVGAVLGRRFDRDLLLAVAGLDERIVDEGLARLVDAELLHARGRGASARYVFKHALVRDAAYASLVRPARRSLHARVARTLEEQRPDTVAALPEVLARHLDAAGDHAAAASSWLRAGATAMRAPAYVEAMAHYEAGLRALQSLSGGAPRTLELDLQLGLGSARMAALGYSAEATQAAYARAERLSGELEDSARLAPALFGLAVYACAHGEQARCRDLGLRLRRIAESAGDTDIALEADGLLAISSCLRGEFDEGFSAVGRALAAWDPDRHRAHMFSFGQEPGIAAYAAYLFLLAFTGHIDEARRAGAEGLETARRIGHPLSLAYLLAGVGLAELIAGDTARVARIAAGDARGDDGARPRDVGRLGGHPRRVGTGPPRRSRWRARRRARGARGPCRDRLPGHAAVLPRRRRRARRGRRSARARRGPPRRRPGARRVVGRADRRAGPRARHRSPRARARRPGDRGARARGSARAGAISRHAGRRRAGGERVGGAARDRGPGPGRRARCSIACRPGRAASRRRPRSAAVRPRCEARGGRRRP